MDKNFEQFEHESQEKPIDWRELYEKYIVYWKWIVVSVFLALLVGLYYSRKQENVYELKSTVLVVDQSKNGGMNEMSMLKQLDAMGIGTTSSTMVNDEDQVIHSTTLMKRVVKQLELYTTYSHKVYLKTHELYTASPLYVRLDSIDLTRLNGSLEMEISPGKEGKVSIDGNFHNNQDGISNTIPFEAEVNRLPARIKTPAGMLNILLRNGKTFPDEVINVKIYDPNAVAKYLVEKALTTDVTKMVDVINLTLQTNNIRKGQDILNTLMAIYNQDAIEQVNQSAINTASFIDSRLKLLSVELGEVEKNVEDYKQKNKLTDIDADAQIYLDKSNVYDQQQVVVETQLHLINYVEQFISSPANKGALIPNLGLTDVGLMAVIEKYNELLMTRNRIASGSSNENPTLKTLNQQIQSARKAIEVSIGNSRKGLQIANKDLTVQNALSLSKIQNIPRQEREFIEIKRQQQVKETLYLFLLQKREEASLNMAVTVPKGRILNTPDDALKTGPHTSIIMLVFLFLGLVIPLLIIFIKDLINTSVSSRAQVEKLTDVPILSELGHNATGEIIIDHASNTDSNAELFRLLRTKLQFALDFPTQKVVMVTSTEPGEGKSYVSINLAISLSMTGKKVIILGMDLRKPQLKKHFNLENESLGMSSYLSGHELDYKKLIQKVKGYATLYTITAGIIPPNPNELLMSDRLDTLIGILRNEYDYIVIDTAPVGAVSDTFLIDRVTDISLYMCRMEYSDKRNLEFLNHVKAEKTLKRPYLVINDMNMESKYYYHRGYSYGYGHYYGHKKTKE